MRYLRTLRTFGPGLVLAGGALVLGVLPDHSAQNGYCAGDPIDTSSDPPCPLPADHHPTEILRFAVAGAIALLIASWMAWRRHRGAPMWTLTRRIRTWVLRWISPLVWLSGFVAVYAGIFALSKLFGNTQVYPGGMENACGLPDADRGTLDECRQLVEDNVFATVAMLIVAALPTLVWGCALTLSRRLSARSAARPDLEPSPRPE